MNAYNTIMRSSENHRNHWQKFVQYSDRLNGANIWHQTIFIRRKRNFAEKLWQPRNLEFYFIYKGVLMKSVIFSIKKRQTTVFGSHILNVFHGLYIDKKQRNIFLTQLKKFICSDINGEQKIISCYGLCLLCVHMILPSAVLKLKIVKYLKKNSMCVSDRKITLLWKRP